MSGRIRQLAAEGSDRGTRVFDVSGISRLPLIGYEGLE
jgi:hypothetical protein